MNDRCFERSEGFVEQNVGEETILVPLVDSVAKMNEVITLNELGTFIYHLLSETRSFAELLAKILEEYEVEEKDAAKDLNLFLSNALEKKIIFEKSC